MNANIDQSALDAATQIMELPANEGFRGGAIQKKARIHVIIADLLRQFQPGGQQGTVPRVGGGTNLKQERIDQAGEWPEVERRHTERRTPSARLRDLAQEALDQYGKETAGGGEPVYPQWAGDVLALVEPASRAMLPVTDCKLVRVADLDNLRYSITGDCYLGQDAEIALVESLAEPVVPEEWARLMSFYCTDTPEGLVRSMELHIKSLQTAPVATTPVAGWVSVEKDALIDRLAKCLVYNKPSLPDHACAECVPHSDMLVAGFRCAYHEAVAIHALKAAPVATPTQQQEQS